MQGKWPLFVVKVSFPQSLAVAVGQFFTLYLAILRLARMNPVPYGNLCSLGSERAKFNLLRGSEICGDKNKATVGRARGTTGHHFTLHGESAYTPRRIGLHSTEHRATLHGASGYTPRSVKRPLAGRCFNHSFPPLRGMGFTILVSMENPERLYLCTYYSAFLTKSNSWGLILSLEETKDHRRGCSFAP